MNNANVIALPASTNFKPEQALKSAQDMGEQITDVLVVGYDAEGALFVRSSHMSRAEALFLLEKAKEWAMYGGINAA
jgi:hypothetical protein